MSAEKIEKNEAPNAQEPKKIALTVPQPSTMTGEELLLQYYDKHKERCIEWIKHHPPTQPFPIAEGKPGDIVWVNRATRRKLARKRV